jgi:hypothetical protein
MTCEKVRMRDGSSGVVCIRGARARKTPCFVCGALATHECDFPSPKRKSGTCDRPLCDVHAIKQAIEMPPMVDLSASLPSIGSVRSGLVADSIDFCPEHDELARTRATAHKASTPQPCLPGFDVREAGMTSQRSHFHPSVDLVADPRTPIRSVQCFGVIRPCESGAHPDGHCRDVSPLGSLPCDPDEAIRRYEAEKASK